MRMTDHQIDLDLTVSLPRRPNLVARVRTSAVRFVRTWLNRSAINRLQDLDDYQLLDIGLRREDIRDALASTYLADPGLHLTIAARERARKHLRSGRLD